MRVHYSIHVYGKVQGVFFRANTQNKAEALGIFGWVRNEPDGSVYIEAEGSEEQMKEFVDWCQHGPTYARVEKVEHKEDELHGFQRFEIKR